MRKSTKFDNMSFNCLNRLVRIDFEYDIITYEIMHMRSDNMKIVLTLKNAFFYMKKKEIDLIVILNFVLKRV